MKDQSLYPGQVQTAFMTMEQIRTLSSVVRSEVFWTFSDREPMSSKEVAIAIDRSPPTVRYHVNELIKAGLLLAVETRKRRSRTEEAYVHSVRALFSGLPPHEPEYEAEIHRGFAALLRAMERERRISFATLNLEPEQRFRQVFRRSYLKLTPKQAGEFREKLLELLEEYSHLEEGPGAERLSAVLYLVPSIASTKKRYLELTGKELLLQKEDEED